MKFLSRGPGYALFLTATEAVIALTKSSAPRRATLRMRVVGANGHARVSGRDQLPGEVNYFRGKDPTRWQTQIPTYAKVSYEGVYPGIDLVYYGNPRELEYDFIVAPHADPAAIALTFDGADKLEVDSDGNLILHTAGGRLTQRAPWVYQEIDGVRKNVASRYSLDKARATESRSFSGALRPDRQLVRFDVGGYDRDQPLVIDPVLVYSTFIGGSLRESGTAIAVDSAGNAYVTGGTESSDFPITPGGFDITPSGSVDVFVTKLQASGGMLAYSTYLGGGRSDLGNAIAVDSAGMAYVAGYTNSNDFPTTPGAFDITLGGSTDVFVTKLQANGGALAYSTYLGGANADFGNGIAVDTAGNAYVAGETRSSDFPTTPGVFDTALGGYSDAFITKLQANGGALAYSTYLGGTIGRLPKGFDSAKAIAVDSAGSVYVTGQTRSRDFPTTPGVFDTTFNGRADAFVTKLEASGEALAYSTFLGGRNREHGFGIAIDSVGSAYVTGSTQSSNFPITAGAFDTTFSGGRGTITDAFVTKLEASGAVLVYSTYLGGAREDAGTAIAVDSGGGAYVTGSTGSSNFPTSVGAFDRTLNANDGFVTKLEADGAAVASSTYLGGGACCEAGSGIAVDSAGSVYVAGTTFSTDFPTTPGAFDTTYAGAGDVFLAKFDDFEEPIKPDLVVAAVSDPPAILGLTQTFAVTETTQNQGGAASVKTTNQYYLSGDTVRNAGDKLLSGAREIPALDAGATSTGTVNVSVPTSAKLGVYHLLVCADDREDEVESDEKNNCRASTTTVEVQAPDLEETAVSDPPAAAAPGDSFSVTDTATNQGTAPAGPTTTRYYLSEDKRKSYIDRRLTGTRAVPELGAGASSTGTITVTIPATQPGTYYLIACADDFKKVLESQERENCKASATTVTVTP